ncbi:hypothetical protein HMPREF1431_00199 [Helicobacter pylori GAMchJs106B]|nr:hypothetical protein HMPREF1431_00199 [Helicobacter pylori GAMchJs106B]
MLVAFAQIAIFYTLMNLFVKGFILGLGKADIGVSFAQKTLHIKGA